MAQPLYSTSVQIDRFSGMNQTGDGYNMSMRFAREMENVNVRGGSFQPMRQGRKIEANLAAPIGTLAYLHRRYGQSLGTLLIAVSDGKVYTKELDGDDDWVQRYEGLTVNDCDWVTYETSLYPNYAENRAYAVGQRVRKPGAVYKCTTAIEEAEAWDSDHWEEQADEDPDSYAVYDPEATYELDDMVTYPEAKNYRCTTAITIPESWTAAHWEEYTNPDPVDILLFTNATDGMHCLYGDTLDVVPVSVTPDPEGRPDENIKFGVIARYNERIWGTAIDGDPDKLMYSCPFDPFDWQQNNEIPEDGAGDILQPTWDGDRFLALRQFGSTLLAVKRNSIWQIYGSNPGEFVMQMQYGGGTIEENTFAVFNNRAYMLGENGPLQYDGTGAYAFQHEALHVLMQEQVTRQLHLENYREYAGGDHCFPGDVRKHEGIVYRCRETTGDHDEETGQIIWDQSWNASRWNPVDTNPMNNTCAGMWDGIYCLALPTNGSDRCNAILQCDLRDGTFSLRTGVSVDSFLEVNERLFYTSADYPGTVWELDDRYGEVKPVKWVSGYQDLGLKSSVKSAFVAYMMVDSPLPIQLRIGIRTEKKLKRKVYTTKPGKTSRIQLNTHGRFFRLEIESYTAAPFMITGGIKLDLELDPD